MRTWQEIVDAATNNTDPQAEHGADVEVFAEAFGLAFMAILKVLTRTCVRCGWCPGHARTPE